MPSGIGILITERISAALISDHAISGDIQTAFGDGSADADSLRGVPAEKVVATIQELLEKIPAADKATALGIAMPGIVRGGTVQDSPNLVQFKGVNMQALVADVLRPKFGDIPVSIFNDADAMAAGIAARQGHLDRLIRVWTLGTGIGYGRYPSSDGVWEAGHSIVSLDPKEQFCACGGKGHLEGIMGHRAMRLRFMDLEPEEVFSQANEGDSRCLDFVKLWHRALAAGTATSIHLDGHGKFFVTGFNARFLNIALLREYLNEMVKLSPLQGYSIEVVQGGEDDALLGAAVNASQIAERS
jgi:glucokinase